MTNHLIMTSVHRRSMNGRGSLKHHQPDGLSGGRHQVNANASLGRPTMKHDDLQSMSIDELWDLHERVVAELGTKMATERDMLEKRLRQLNVAGGELSREKRPYPKVYPKYRNPKNHNETWAGRGKQPRWLLDQLQSGKKLTDFLIG